MHLIKALNDLGQRINRYYPAVNSGGCCVFAAAVGKELADRGIETRIIVAASNATSHLDRVRPTLNNINQKSEWNDNDVWFNHVGVEFKYGSRWYHFDSDGVGPRKRSLKSWAIYPGRLSVDEAKALADEPEGWNDYFDREKIPAMKRHIQRYLAANLQM